MKIRLINFQTIAIAIAMGIGIGIGTRKSQLNAELHMDHVTLRAPMEV